VYLSEAMTTRFMLFLCLNDLFQDCTKDIAQTMSHHILEWSAVHLHQLFQEAQQRRNTETIRNILFNNCFVLFIVDIFAFFSL
jgi:hypothetical protein